MPQCLREKKIKQKPSVFSVPSGDKKNLQLGESFGPADFLEFAAEAGLYKAHAKAWTTSFSAENFYSKPTGMFVIIAIKTQHSAFITHNSAKPQQLAIILRLLCQIYILN